LRVSTAWFIAGCVFIEIGRIGVVFVDLLAVLVDLEIENVVVMIENSEHGALEVCRKTGSEVCKYFAVL
jgi:hypothetical protein